MRPTLVGKASATTVITESRCDLLVREQPQGITTKAYGRNTPRTTHVRPPLIDTGASQNPVGITLLNATTESRSALRANSHGCYTGHVDIRGQTRSGQTRSGQTWAGQTRPHF